DVDRDELLRAQPPRRVAIVRALHDLVLLLDHAGDRLLEARAPLSLDVEQHDVLVFGGLRLPDERQESASQHCKRDSELSPGGHATTGCKRSACRMSVQKWVLAAACSETWLGCCITLEARLPTGSRAPLQVGVGMARSPGHRVAGIRKSSSVTRSASVFWPGAALLCACSVVGGKGPPSSLQPGEAPECTSSMTLPLLDFASAIIAGSAAVLLHGQASSERDKPDGGSSKEMRTAAWSATRVAVLFIASGAYGSRQVRRRRGLGVTAGIAPSEELNPNWQEESKPGPGQLGSRCKRD